MNKAMVKQLRFSAISKLDSGDWLCQSTDGSLTLHLNSGMFPNKPYPYKEYVMTYDEVDYLIEDAPPLLSHNREQKDLLFGLVDKLKRK